VFPVAAAAAAEIIATYSSRQLFSSSTRHSSLHNGCRRRVLGDEDDAGADEDGDIILRLGTRPRRLSVEGGLRPETVCSMFVAEEVSMRHGGKAT